MSDQSSPTVNQVKQIIEKTIESTYGVTHSDIRQALSQAEDFAGQESRITFATVFRDPPKAPEISVEETQLALRSVGESSTSMSPVSTPPSQPLDLETTRIAGVKDGTPGYLDVYSIGPFVSLSNQEQE